MPLKYRLIPRGNPAKPEAPKKFYATVVTKGEVTQRQLAKDIAAISTVSEVDTMAMLEAMLQIIPKHLAEGNIVRLGDFGSFSIQITSDGAETETAFNATLMDTPKIVFRPGQETKNILNSIKFEKEA